MTSRPPPAPLPELNSFDDVVALAEAKRDLKLKHALLEQVRLVRFKPGHHRAQPAAAGAARARPGADAQAQGLDRPRLDRRRER